MFLSLFFSLVSETKGALDTCFLFSAAPFPTQLPHQYGVSLTGPRPLGLLAGVLILLVRVKSLWTRVLFTHDNLTRLAGRKENTRQVKLLTFG